MWPVLSIQVKLLHEGTFNPAILFSLLAFHFLLCYYILFSEKIGPFHNIFMLKSRQLQVIDGCLGGRNTNSPPTFVVQPWMWVLVNCGSDVYL